MKYIFSVLHSSSFLILTTTFWDIINISIFQMKIIGIERLSSLSKVTQLVGYLDPDKYALENILLSTDLKVRGTYWRTTIGTRKVHSDRRVKWGGEDRGEMTRDRCDSDQHSARHTQLVIANVYVTRTRCAVLLSALHIHHPA